MKKLKLLILGIFGLLTFVSSYSFAGVGSTDKFMIETYTQKASFLGESQLFNLITTNWIGSTDDQKGSYFNFARYFAGSWTKSLCFSSNPLTSCQNVSTLYSNDGFSGTGNSSYTGFVPYYMPFWFFLRTNYSRGSFYDPSRIKVYSSLNSSDFGVLMLQLTEPGYRQVSATYSFGSGRFSGTPTIRSLGDYYGGVRLMFENIGDDDNFINPTNGFDLISQSGTQQKYAFLERFTLQGSVVEGKFNGTYQSKSIIDSRGISAFGFTKGKHFGLNGLGYSFAYNSYENPDQVRTTSFGFGTVASSILIELNSSNTNYGQYIGNVGIFKADTYGSIGSDTRIVAIDRVAGSAYRNQLAYEIFDCGSDPTDNPYDILKSNSNCQSLQYGLLGLYSGGSLTSQILPFDVLDDYYLYTIGSGNEVIDFFFTGAILGYTKIESDGIRFSSFSDTNSTNAIKTPYDTGYRDLKLYFMPGGQVIGDQRQENHPVGGGNGGGSSTGGTIYLGNNSYSSTYYKCLGPTYNTPDGKPPIECLDSSGNLIDVNDYKDCWYETDVISGQLASTMYCVVNGYVQPMTWESSGSGGQYVPCSGDDCSSIFKIGPSLLSGSDLTGDYLTTGLVDSLITNITGWLFKCPFPYNDFELGKNFGLTKYLKTLGFSFDPLIFINCSWAGLQYGRSLVDESLGLGDLWEYGPLIKRSGSSFVYTNALCSFFDFILILTLIGLVKFIRKLF